MISIDCLIGSAMVIPFFSFHEKKKNQDIKYGTPVVGKPSIVDKFWYMERQFFDRSGWEELNNSSIRSNSSNSKSNIRNGINIDDIQSFLVQHCIPGTSILPTSGLDFENIDFDADFDVNILNDEVDDDD